jgi:hypothetical protein
MMRVVAASADADELGPDCRESCADQDILRVVAERSPIGAHLRPERADLMAAGQIEHAGQDGQCGSDEVHRSISSRSGCRFCACPIAHLTRRANQRHIDIIAKSYGPRLKPAAGFSISAMKFAEAVSICLIFLVAFSLKFEFDPSGKSLAESHHRKKITKPAPETARGLFLLRIGDARLDCVLAMFY